MHKCSCSQSKSFSFGGIPCSPTAILQAVLDYLLNTITDDLAFEITRVRPLITDAFYAHVDGLIEAERQKEAAAVAGVHHRGHDVGFHSGK